MTTLDRVREIIRSEVARANPREESRRALELIAETSLRYEETDGALRISVVDEDGHHRTVVRDGREVDCTIQDLVAELRGRHPSLFGTDSGHGSEPARPAGAPSVERAAAPLADADRPAGAEAAAPSVGPVAAPLAEADRPAGAEAAAPSVERGAARPAEAAPSGPAHAARPPVRDILGLSSTAAETPSSVERAHEPSPEPAPAAEDRSPPDPLGGETPSPVETGRDPIVAGWVPPTARLHATLGRGLGRIGAIRRGAAWPRLGGTGLTGLPLRSRGLGLRSALSLAAIAILVPLVAVLAMSVIGDSRATRPPDAPTTVAVRSATEPEATGTVPGQEPSPARPADGPLRGVPEVLDTATLSVQGKVVRLFGVEWAKGAGDPDDLAGYLRGREVMCRPEGATDKYRCEVQGQDLSRVVLYNGAGRATPEATPDLKAAEEHARSQQLGVWGAESLKAKP